MVSARPAKPVAACPNCGAAPASPDAAECPACGVFFAKFAEKQERERRAALAALERPASPEEVPRARLTPRGAALLLVLGWMLLMALYYVVVGPRGAVRVEPGAVYEPGAALRDPETGERIEVINARERPLPAPVVERDVPAEAADEFELDAEREAAAGRD